MNLPTYVPVQMGFNPNGDLVVVYQPAYPVKQELDLVENFYGRKLSSEQVRLAKLAGLAPERMKLLSGAPQIQGEDDEDCDDCL